MNVFTKPPRLRELGDQADQSYWSVRRMAMAGVIPIVNFPGGQRVDVDWANRYVRSRYLAVNPITLPVASHRRTSRDAPVGGAGANPRG
jgi:hypothetical protein